MRKKIIVIFVILLFLTSACSATVGQLNNRGNRLFAAGKFDEALTAYQQAQTQNPAAAEPYYNAANAYYRQKNYGQAELQAQQALQRADLPLAEQSYFNLGNIYFQNGQFEQAAEAYKQALRINPADMDAKYNLELTLQKLKKQKQQQKNQQNNQNSPQNQPTPTPTPAPKPSPSPTAGTPTPQSQGQPTPTAGATSTPQNQGQPQNSQNEQPSQTQPAQPQQLSPEQARRLLESVAGDTKTLQQKLMELYGAPPAKGKLPAEDW